MTRTPFARPPAPTAHDLKLWEALVDKADRSAAKPATDPGPLMRAGDRAFKARMPIGQQVRNSACVRLVALAKLWWRLSPEVRLERAEDLARVAAEVRGVLVDPTGSEVGRRVLPPADR
jgi:hypothetical protein